MKTIKMLFMGVLLGLLVGLWLGVNIGKGNPIFGNFSIIFSFKLIRYIFLKTILLRDLMQAISEVF